MITSHPTFSILLALSTYFAYRLFKRSQHLKEIPGPPSPSFLFGNIIDYETALVGTRYNVWAKKYGTAFKIRGALLEPQLILTDPKAAAYILSSHPTKYVRPLADRVVLETIFGRGVFCSEGEEHRRMRKTLNEAFRSQSIDEVSPVLFELASRLKSEWDSLIERNGGKPVVVNVSNAFAVLALDAITKTMLNYDCTAMNSPIPDIARELASPIGDKMSLVLGTLAESFPILLKIPSPVMTLFVRMKEELRKIAEEAWTNAADKAKVLDILGAGDGTQKEEVLATVLEIIFAGSETTANVTGECLYEMSRNPKIQNRLRAELVSFEEERGRTPSLNDLNDSSTLPYLDAVIKETLRTKAVLMEISRTAMISDNIPLKYPVLGTNDYFVRVEEGQLIQIAIRDGINTDERIWGSNAREFRPERWIEPGGVPESVKDIHAPMNVLSFGDGPKICLGRLFALAELKILISTVVRNFIVEEEGSIIDFYHLGGNTVKPTVRGKEKDGVQLPLKIRKVGKA